MKDHWGLRQGSALAAAVLLEHTQLSFLGLTVCTQLFAQLCFKPNQASALAEKQHSKKRENFGVFRVVSVSPLICLSVTMPRLFKDDAVAKGAAGLASALLKKYR